MSEQATTTILLIDDHALFRASLRRLIEVKPGLKVIGEASNGREGLEQLQKLQPDLAFLDLNMPQQSGLEVLRRLSNVNTKSRIIMMVASIEKHQIVEALRMGARGVVFKNMASQLLYRSIETVMGGGYFVGREIIRDLVNILRSTGESERVPAKPGTYGLTRREFEILSTVVDGYTNKEIAEKYMISEQTVKHHLTSIFEKVGVSNRMELALLAMNQGLTYDS
jgi:two-component system, NarL family, nitrate/nitrite response regulator NarL